MKIDHIGIVVSDIQEALKVYKTALGLPLAEMVEVHDQKVKVAFLPIGESNIELVQPTTADTGIAIERYRRQHGKLPEKLDELVPEFLPQVPVDPYDGQPLRYVVDAEGCRVYSVGMNHTDEGGKGDLAGDPDKDIVFRLGLPGGPREK